MVGFGLACCFAVAVVGRVRVCVTGAGGWWVLYCALCCVVVCLMLVLIAVGGWFGLWLFSLFV